MRLLLAEDEKALSKALTTILERNNYSVDAVFDGQEALEYLEVDNYDCVILDIMMPKVDGITVLKEIRKKGSLIPVLMLTAKSEVDDKVLGLDAGANDYLTILSRMEESRRETVTVDFPFSDMVEETVNTFQALAKTQKKTLVSEITLMISICGEEKALNRLVTILLDNALKYSEDGGQILVRLEKEKKRIRLSVYNTTEFISREHLEHLFDRFYRTDSSRNSQTGGYGLGLSIASATVEAHRGKITASTEDEKSLMITVTLPAV